MHSRRKEATPSTNCINDGTKSHIVQICTGTQWQCICAKSNSTFWSENEDRVACYDMGMSWEEGSGDY